MKDPRFLEYVLKDVLEHIRNITYKHMFGGYGIYKNGIIFAIIAWDQLYFKVDERTVDAYKKLGSEHFTYERGGKTASLHYWTVPEEIMSDKEKIKEWVEEAVGVSRKSKKK